MIQKTEAVVLRRIDFRETSVMLTLFTKDFGKIKGLAKGVRVPKSRWGSSLSLFSHNSIVFYEKRELHLITQADLIDALGSGAFSYERKLAANYMSELIDLIMPLEDKNEPLFDMFLDSLCCLGKDKDLARLIHIFEVKLLKISGFTPRIDSCVRCKNSISDIAHFSNRLGGLLCRACLNHDKRSQFINHGTIFTLNHILNTSSDRMISRLKMTVPIKDNLGYILRGFLAYHLDRIPRSSPFIQKVLSKI